MLHTSAVALLAGCRTYFDVVTTLCALVAPSIFAEKTGVISVQSEVQWLVALGFDDITIMDICAHDRHHYQESVR